MTERAEVDVEKEQPEPVCAQAYCGERAYCSEAGACLAEPSSPPGQPT